MVLFHQFIFLKTYLGGCSLPVVLKPENILAYSLVARIFEGLIFNQNLEFVVSSNSSHTGDIIIIEVFISHTLEIVLSQSDNLSNQTKSPNQLFKDA